MANSNELNLTDEYVELLDDVVKENRMLRKEIREQGEVLKNLTSTLNRLNERSPPKESSCVRSRKRQRKETTVVPQQCRRSFRKFYKELAEREDGTGGFKCDKSFSDKENQEVVKSVTTEVINDNGGATNCPWSKEQIAGAAASYYKTKRDEYQRIKKQKNDQHRTTCRRQGRLRDKLHRRLSTLERMRGDEELRARAREVMSIEYMSSDESDMSEDEDGNIVIRGYLTKKLPWERAALKKIKSDLDQKYKTYLPSRVKRGLCSRGPHTQQSLRPVPPNSPSWAVRLPDSHSTPI